MVRSVCEYCGKGYESKTDRSRYCSTSCRIKVSKMRKEHGLPNGTKVSMYGIGVDPPEMIGGESTLATPSNLQEEVRRVLEKADKGGWQAEQALELARKLSTPGETGAASLSKELDRVMKAILADVTVETDELDAMQAKVVEFRRRRSG